MRQIECPCLHCDHAATDHAVDDEERRECTVDGCDCEQYEIGEEPPCDK